MLAGSLLLSLSVLPPVRAGSAKPGETGIVQKEVERRVKVKDQAQLLIAEGDALAVRGDQCGAADKYRAAVSLMLPGAPATQALRTSAVKKFAVSGVACAKELAETGDYEKARQRLEQVLAADMAPKDGPALTLQKHLKDPGPLQSRAQSRPRGGRKEGFQSPHDGREVHGDRGLQGGGEFL